MAEMFTVEIITPDRIFYTGEVDFLEFTTVAGEIGVYKKHVPTTTVLAPGVVTLHEEGETKKAAVHGGFAEILPDKVTLLAEAAEWPEEVDANRAKSAMDRAKERLERKEAGTDIMRAELALKRAMARIKITE